MPGALSSRYRWWPPCGHSLYGIEIGKHTTHWSCPKCLEIYPVRVKGKICDSWGNLVEFTAKCPCNTGFTFEDDGTRMTTAKCNTCRTVIDLNYQTFRGHKGTPFEKMTGTIDGKCYCDIKALWREGCKCGGFKEETK